MTFVPSSRAIIALVFVCAACGSTPTDGAPDAAPPPTTADLYVAPNGNDGAAGTMSDPTTLAAVDAKIKLLQPNRATPIVVFLEDGTYDLQQSWTPSVSGTAQAPVVYAAAPGATPVLSGGMQIKNWTKTTINGVDAWQASAAGLAPFEQLWVNGTRHYRPTTTPQGYLYNANTPQVGATYTSFTYAGIDVAPSYYDLAHVEVDDFESWTMPRMHIASISPSTNTVTLTGSTQVNNPGMVSHGFIPRHRYLLENVKEALTLPGQWYLDQPASTVYYVPVSPSEDPNTESIVAPQLTTALMTAQNLSYVTFRGITFSYANWTVPQEGWKDCQTESDSSARLPAAVSIQGASFVSVASCVVAHVSQIGIELLGSDSQITDSEVTDTGGSGIRIGAYMNATTDTDANVSQRILVQDDVVSGVGRFFPSGNGIFVGNAHHVTVSHNEVFDTYTYAIDVGDTYGNRPGMPYSVAGNAHDETIELNLVHDVGQGITSDIGGIYLATGPQMGNVVQNNVVHDVTHDPGNAAANSPEGYGGWGLYNDASSSNVTWQNNLVYRCSQSPLTFNYGMNAVIQNNILAFGGEGIVTRAQDEGHLSFTFQNNIIYSDTSVWQYGNWSCSAGATTLCYVMKDNIYVDSTGTPEFIQSATGITKLAKPYNGPVLSFAQWQGAGEDPSPSTDSFALPFGSAASPTFTLPPNLPTSFVPFDPTQAGRTSSVPSPAAVPPAFPLQPWPGTL